MRTVFLSPERDVLFCLFYILSIFFYRCLSLTMFTCWKRLYLCESDALKNECNYEEQWIFNNTKCCYECNYQTLFVWHFSYNLLNTKWFIELKQWKQQIVLFLFLFFYCILKKNSPYPTTQNNPNEQDHTHTFIIHQKRYNPTFLSKKQ